MKKYEYQMLPLSTSKWGILSIEKNEMLLTDAGLQGWKYIDRIASSSGKSFFLMERQVSGEYSSSPDVDTLV